MTTPWIAVIPGSAPLVDHVAGLQQKQIALKRNAAVMPPAPSSAARLPFAALQLRTLTRSDPLRMEC